MGTSKKIREEAILLLNALASRRNTEAWPQLNFFGMSEHLEISNDALSLARDCFDHVPSLHACVAHYIDEDHPGAFELECAQAAILVSEGWEKGNTIKEQPAIMLETQPEIMELDGLN